MEDLENLYGRIFTAKQISDEAQKVARTKDSFEGDGKAYYCGRCLSKAGKDHLLPNGHYYCRQCLVFGRVQSHDKLYYFPAPPFLKGNYLKWKGSLTPYQESISKQLVENYYLGKWSLVYAVTGAGKTEMIYSIIKEVVNSGKWVALVSPRVDVCIEVYKRLSRDFSCQTILMHAGSESYHRAPLVIATTHQLLKFYKAFHLIIIDEVDSFPFVDNPLLNRAVMSALKEEGQLIYLTATSTKFLESEVTKGKLIKLTLPRRFHNNPLIVPKFQLILNFQNYLDKGKLPTKLYSAIQKQTSLPYPLLIFYPVIEKGQMFYDSLVKSFPNHQIGYVSSQTAKRKELIEDFRQGSLSILVTTTILERGVTFPGVDVFVVLAHHHLFTSSSLIQIAGRVGRSIDRPNGKVIFFHEGVSSAMYKARKEIIALNKEAYGS
ncbi:DEAD/DEAH box helicase [Streptococcus pseudoporcinus]|uniref:Helicase C-terminal domain protein n=1 Tax=Streptococcus pseudoporcinus LQ 940-04 TaxID=875093 RepID=G5K819_9STRE|nr:DEAD/DEAH box helicase [Streptococcus pseudoporcinus]EFR45243.1 helicase C-terminal domain protein [Streptococcus pseudoporcinus SPIN 20026]EHI65263.1 helicase C-terminal domain protein [Streptococcus pseudoporcinus LQ 940-04]VEF94278.1 late competence protein [Streptococcus pseudoporcinus]